MMGQTYEPDALTTSKNMEKIQCFSHVAVIHAKRVGYGNRLCGVSYNKSIFKAAICN